MSIKPISPGEAIEQKRSFPDEVIEAFNEIIVENLRNGRSSFKQKAVIEKIISKFENLATEEEIIKNNWLDVENIYREAGWKVIYVSSRYGSTYFEPYFDFTKPNTKPASPESIEYIRGAY